LRAFFSSWRESSLRFSSTARCVCLLALLGFAGLPAVGVGATEESVPGQILDTVSRLTTAYETGPDARPMLILNSPSGQYREGDTFSIKVEDEVETRYLYIDYFQLDGNVVHLLPSPGRPEHKVAAGKQVSIGRDKNGPRYTVLPPFGRELILAIASSIKLYKEPRREFENAGVYLTFLNSALADGDAAGADIGFQQLEILTSPYEIAAPKVPESGLVAQDPDSDLDDAPTPTEVAETADVGQATLAPANGAANSAQISSVGIYRTDIYPRLNRVVEDPEDTDNLAALASAYRSYVVALANEGQPAKAREELEIAAALTANDPEIMAAQQDLENIEQAEVSYQQAIDYLKEGDWEKAHGALTEAVRTAPTHAGAKSKLTNIEPQLADYYRRRAEDAALEAKFQQSLNYWNRVAELEPQNQAAEAAIARLKERLATGSD